MIITFKQLSLSYLERQQIRQLSKDIGIDRKTKKGSIGYTKTEYSAMLETAKKRRKERSYLYTSEYIDTFKKAVKLASEIVDI